MRIRREVDARTRAAAARLRRSTPTPSLDDIGDDRGEFMPASPPSLPVPRAVGMHGLPYQVASDMVYVAHINMYLHRKKNNLASGDHGEDIDPPQPCACEDCPFSTGPLLRQRFALLQRVYQLNCTMYGKGPGQEVLKFI